MPEVSRQRAAGWKASLLLTLVAASLLTAAPVRPQAIEIGVFTDESGPADRAAHWRRALRGGAFDVRDEVDQGAAFDPERTPLIVLEDHCLSERLSAALSDWVRAGGLLIVSGPDCTDRPEEASASTRRRLSLAGLAPAGVDPGLEGIYPRVVEGHPLLSPFLVGDGVRLGKSAIESHWRVHAEDAVVLARGYRLEPGPSGLIHESAHPTITLRQAGRGAVIYLHQSLARITACFPDNAGRATDCSGAGTARTLMRQLVANALWEFRGIQAPLPRQTPGMGRVSVVVTGDVHADEEAFQVRSARQMALSLADTGAPLTWFVSGRVARQTPGHLSALQGMEGVTLGAHSVDEEKYQPGFLEGEDRIVQDMRRAEALLDLPRWPDERSWLTAFRSHGWASDQTQAGAWSALARAGVGLVFDHNADALLDRQSVSAPAAWFESDIRQRLFVPVPESSVTTEVDDFVLDDALEHRIASLASPEPDPCCNDSVTFDAYADYVEAWHQAFLRLGSLGGVTEVWLWHPSTPVWKGGLDRLKQMLTGMRKDPDVLLLSAHELATWVHNREHWRVEARRDSDGRLSALDLDPKGNAEPVPLPPGASSASKAISYWIIGKADPAGWQTRQQRDPYGRTITVMSRPMEPAGQ